VSCETLLKKPYLYKQGQESEVWAQSQIYISVAQYITIGTNIHVRCQRHLTTSSTDNIRQNLKSTRLIVVCKRSLKACLNGSNIVGPTSSNNVTIIDMAASLSNLFG
jgi:hypothetical protein